MATVTQEMLTCDVCGSADNVQTRAFGFDGKQYEIDLCPEDGNGLNAVAEGCIPHARKVTSKGQRPNSRRRPPRGTAPGGKPKPARSQPRKAKPTPKQTANDKQQKNGPGQRSSGATVPSGEAKPARSQPRKAKPAPKQATKPTPKQTAKATPRQATKPTPKQATKPTPKQATKPTPKQATKPTPKQATKPAPKQTAKPTPTPKQAAKPAPKQATNDEQQENGVYVYGILPADIEIAAETPGVGEHPGPLEVVRSDGLAALISEVNQPGHLGSPEDLKTHREILDSTAIEVPVFPLRFGTVLAGEGAVAEELLGPRHDEFAAALEKLEGRTEFVVKGRYVQQAILGEVLAENNRAAQLRDMIQSKGSGAAGEERTELGKILNETIAVRREEDTRALRQAMEGVCVASVVRKPARGLDAVDVAFLVAVDEESAMEQVIEDLAREWEGRIEVQLLGPMAAYDFVRT